MTFMECAFAIHGFGGGIRRRQKKTGRHERITTRKETLIIGYISSSLHGTLTGRTWMRATTLFSHTLGVIGSHYPYWRLKDIHVYKLVCSLYFVLTTLVGVGAFSMQGVCQSKYDTCFTFHGRLLVGNGTPSFRIWIVGTNHMLGVMENDYGMPDMPDTLAKLAHFDKYVFGDYKVCPLTKYHKGEMQIARVLSASKLRVVNR